VNNALGAVAQREGGATLQEKANHLSHTST
jgi:hypothetical protein